MKAGASCGSQGKVSGVWGQMDFLSGETATHFLIAIAVVGLGLVAYAGVLKFLRERPLSPLMAVTGRERSRRLTVLDAAVIDTRRRVVLIRRDNVEHLVLIGGPTDVVIESRIGLEEQLAAAREPRKQEQAHDSEPVRRAQPRAQTPRPQAPRPAAETPRDELPAVAPEDTDYLYGPNATLDARDYQPEPPAYREDRQPVHPQAEAAKPTAASVAEANAESIIQMLRSRILNDAAAAAAQQPARPAEPTPRQREISTFERLLNERLNAPDRTAATKPAPSARSNVPAQPGVGPATARAAAAAAPALPQAKDMPADKAKSEVALEMEVARILEELQTRRRQKQNP